MLLRSLFSNIFKFLFIVSLPPVLALTNLYFFVSPSFVESQYRQLRAEPGSFLILVGGQE